MRKLADSSSLRKWKLFGFLAVFTLMTITIIPSAAANGLPLTATVHSSGGSLRPAGSIPVGVVREHLLLDLRERQASIRATYQLLNQSHDALDVMVAFPVPQYSGIDPEKEARAVVQLDGQQIRATAASVPVVLEPLDTSVSSEWLDPFTGEVYHPPILREPKPTAVLTFSVPFTGRQERTLQVEYRQFPSEDNARFINPAMRYDYLLRPARHWVAFGELEVEVLVPPGRVIRSVPLLRLIGKDRYSATFGALPNENLSVFVAPGGGFSNLTSWWWRRSGRAVILVALTVLTSFASGWLCVSRIRVLKLMGIILRYGLPLVVIVLTPSHLFEPSPGGAMKTWFLFVPSLAAVYLLGGWFPRYFLRRRARDSGANV